jgi:putative OPT family oligopeptide transporter
MIGKNDPSAIVYPGRIAIATMDAEQIFRSYIRFVGVGAIATAGVFGIFKSLRVVAGSFSIAAHTFQKGKESGLERTDRDISILSIAIGVVIVTLCATLFFGTLEARSFLFVTIALLLTLLFSFFFTSVAANAIATTARNPVSGMTMLTIIISSIIFLRFGLSGTTGMFFIMAIAGMVCTALSVSGQTITDLKTGYWLGSTPAVQEKVKFLGIAISSLAAGLTIVLLAKIFQFGDVAEGDARAVLVSPQASIMKALVEGFMTGQPVAYILFGAGAAIAVVMEMLGVPALVFALGMYLPLELNSPALVGGFLCYLVNRRAERHASQKRAKIRERGIIIASGLMAGGALGGVIGASLRLFPWYAENRIKTPFYDHESTSQIVSLVLFIGLCLFLWFDSIRVGEKDGGQ